MKNQSITVVNNPDKKRFETKVDGHLAIAEYTLTEDQITFTHTKVPKEIGGRGIASKLAKYALGYARQEGLKVIPQCSFFASYIQRNEEYQDLLQPGFEMK